jgi:aromatic-L-amino-acid decarboxylase
LPIPPSLELDAPTLRAMIERATERLAQHVESLPTQPMHATTGGRKLARALRMPMPERGVSFDRLVRLLFGRVLPASLNTASPGYLAYIPGGGLVHSAVADLITDVTNRYVGVFLAAPGLVQLEANVVRWFCDVLGLPRTAGGVLTTGGSLANFSAVVAARRDRLPEDFLRGTIYVSEEAHHSVQKAAMLAGFPEARVRVIPSDQRFRMRIDALERLITEDREAGLTPFLLVGSAGTTATGAVDDLEALGDIATRERLWLHVDAAYGGFFALTERGRAILKGIERADSVTLDPHKGLFLPYGTGCLVVRDEDTLRRAHSMTASYLPPMQTEEGLVDFCELSPELSRGARGLRVWLPLMMHGAGVFREALDEKLDLARMAARRLREMDGVEVVAEPELSLLAFRVTRAGLEGEALDAFNRRVMSAVNARQRVLLTGAVVHGRFLIRMCILSFRTHADRIEMALEDVGAALREVRENLRASGG